MRSESGRSSESFDCGTEYTKEGPEAAQAADSIESSGTQPLRWGSSEAERMRTRRAEVDRATGSTTAADASERAEDSSLCSADAGPHEGAVSGALRGGPPNSFKDLG